MYLLEPVANVTEIAQAKSAVSARRASHVADNTDEVASLDRVSAPPGDLSRRLTPLGHRECEEAHIETSGFGTKRRLGNVRFCAACGPKRTSDQRLPNSRFMSRRPSLG